MYILSKWDNKLCNNVRINKPNKIPVLGHGHSSDGAGPGETYIALAEDEPVQ